MFLNADVELLFVEMVCVWGIRPMDVVVILEHGRGNEFSGAVDSERGFVLVGTCDQLDRFCLTSVPAYLQRLRCLAAQDRSERVCGQQESDIWQNGVGQCRDGFNHFFQSELSVDRQFEMYSGKILKHQPHGPAVNHQLPDWPIDQEHLPQTVESDAKFYG